MRTSPPSTRNRTDEVRTSARMVRESVRGPVVAGEACTELGSGEGSQRTLVSWVDRLLRPQTLRTWR
jgi:hypothetical protein